MTHMIRTLTLSAAALTLATAGYAQTRGVVDIPFAFKVNGKTMPAGKYELNRPFHNSGAAGLIELTHDGVSRYASGISTGAAADPGWTKLVFTCGDASGCTLVQLHDRYGAGIEFKEPKLNAAEKERRAEVTFKSTSE